MGNLLLFLLGFVLGFLLGRNEPKMEELELQEIDPEHIRELARRIRREGGPS